MGYSRSLMSVVKEAEKNKIFVQKIKNEKTQYLSNPSSKEKVIKFAKPEDVIDEYINLLFPGPISDATRRKARPIIEDMLKGELTRDQAREALKELAGVGKEIIPKEEEPSLPAWSKVIEDIFKGKPSTTPPTEPKDYIQAARYWQKNPFTTRKESENINNWINEFKETGKIPEGLKFWVEKKSGKIAEYELEALQESKKEGFIIPDEKINQMAEEAHKYTIQATQSFLPDWLESYIGKVHASWIASTTLPMIASKPFWKTDILNSWVENDRYSTKEESDYWFDNIYLESVPEKFKGLLEDFDWESYQGGLVDVPQIPLSPQEAELKKASNFLMAEAKPLFQRAQVLLNEYIDEISKQTGQSRNVIINQLVETKVRSIDELTSELIFPFTFSNSTVSKQAMLAHVNAKTGEMLNSVKYKYPEVSVYTPGRDAYFGMASEAIKNIFTERNPSERFKEAVDINPDIQEIPRVSFRKAFRPTAEAPGINLVLDLLTFQYPQPIGFVGAEVEIKEPSPWIPWSEKEITKDTWSPKFEQFVRQDVVKTFQEIVSFYDQMEPSITREDMLENFDKFLDPYIDTYVRLYPQKFTPIPDTTKGEKALWNLRSNLKHKVLTKHKTHLPRGAVGTWIRGKGSEYYDRLSLLHDYALHLWKALDTGKVEF